MCGIAGIWGRVEPGPVRAMMASQRHRGPDGDGLYAHPGGGVLGHTRLAIMDPRGGQQPIHNEDRSAAVVANGMIYNHPQLRRRLRRAHRFGSDSDSETILHVFEEHGMDTPRLLDGMFAFAIASGERLFLARDPVGIKPLYYARSASASGDEALYFASELKALCPLAGEIKEFPPGSCYDSRTGFRRYYLVPDRIPRELPLETHLRRVRETVEAAVVKRLLSDVPLGAFLSGGLDSSVIAAIARRHMPELHTFSVGIEGSRDLQAARRAAEHIGTIHHEYVYTAAEVLEKLPEIVYYLESFDQDLVRSAIPTYFCARLAAEHVKVVLTGEGADELFAGYAYHKSIDRGEALHRELRRSVTRLHNVNLQRVDRMTMRHGIEARVPFLDTGVIELAQSVSPEWKLYRNGAGRLVEKWILRKAFEDLLPPDILWRDKEQFDEGSGMVDLIPAVLDRAPSAGDAAAYAAQHAGDRLRTAEECLYHRLLVSQFEHPEAVLANVGRWRPD
jgi:asparagine synthase (glutamine-hydrolysing)